MTELHTRKKGSAFEDWTATQAGNRLRDSVALINRFAGYGVAVSCELKEITQLGPKRAAKGSEHFLDGFRSAYATCCHMAMFTLGKVVSHTSQESKIAYFFEVGDENQAEAARFWDLASAFPPLKSSYLHVSHSVIAKADCRLLEMSDIFAWEWAKHRERINAGSGMRPSLKALLEANSKGAMSLTDFAADGRFALHLTGDSLKRYFDQVKDLILS